MIYVTHDQTEAMTLGHRIAVLDRGRLQQVAAPHELYEQPANAFVASFIGTPPMNIFPVRVRRTDRAALQLTVADQVLTVPADAAPPDAERAQRAGLRPEAVSVASAGANEPSLETTVEHVEFLGHETLAHVRLGADSTALQLVVRLAGMPALGPDERLRLAVDVRRLHLFDAEGRALQLQRSTDGHS